MQTIVLYKVFGLFSSSSSSLFIYLFIYFNTDWLHWIPFADSPHDSVQFIEWSPGYCLLALLKANILEMITIWTQPFPVS